MKLAISLTAKVDRLELVLDSLFAAGNARGPHVATLWYSVEDHFAHIISSC